MIASDMSKKCCFPLCVATRAHSHVVSIVSGERSKVKAVTKSSQKRKHHATPFALRPSLGCFILACLLFFDLDIALVGLRAFSHGQKCRNKAKIVEICESLNWKDKFGV